MNSFFTRKMKPVAYAKKRSILMLSLLCLPVLLVSLPHAVQAQTQTPPVITGRVVDSEGTPVAGVNVYDRARTGVGTATDGEGRYSLRNVPPGATLTFSMIGYENQDVAVQSRTVIDVTLRDDATEIDAVTVEVPIGYGTQKAEHIAGAVAVIDPQTIADLPSGDLSTSLRGLVPGLAVSDDGMRRPGSSANLTIRSPFDLAKDGTGTGPLIVIDDVLQISAEGKMDMSTFNMLDPTEIESIVILKDAAAAIYGARASQGAIVVKTKRGKKGPPKISYSGQYAWNDARRHPKTQSAYDYGIGWNRYQRARQADPTNLNNYFQEDELEAMKGMDYDWLDEAWRIGSQYRHTLNLSGGTDNASYYAGITYFTQDGNLGKLDNEKWTMRAGVDLRVAKNLKASFSLSANNSYRHGAYNKIGGSNPERDYDLLLNTPKYIPWEVDGLYTSWIYNPTDGGVPNAPNNNNKISNLNHFESKRSDMFTTTKGNSYNFNLSLEYEVPFIPGLVLKGTYSQDRSFSYGKEQGGSFDILQPVKEKMQGSGRHLYSTDIEDYAQATVKVSNTDRYVFAKSNGESYQANFYAIYNRTFGKHYVNGFFSIERGEGESHDLTLIKEGLFDYTNGESNTASKYDESNTRTNKKVQGSLSYIGRINYVYNDRYVLQFQIRSDASTKFAPENYWGVFPSVAVAWLMHKEEFFVNRSRFRWVDSFKLRASYGRLGKDNVQQWRWLQRYGYRGDNGALFGVSDTGNVGWGARMDVSPNRDAHWDTSHKYNLGVDLGLFGGRFNLGYDYWFDKNVDMLKQRTYNAPITVGGSIAEDNFARVNSWGHELSIGWHDKVRDFRYGISMNVGISSGKNIDIGVELSPTTLPWNQNEYNGSKRPKSGKWGYDCLGMFRTQQEINDYVDKYKVTKVFGTEVVRDPLTNDVISLKPGMLYYNDIRGKLNADGTFEEPDGIISENDMIRLSPDRTWGVSSNITLGWKGIDVSAQIAASWGDWYQLDVINPRGDGNERQWVSLPIYWNDMFDPVDNPNGKYPNPFYRDINDRTSKYWKVDSFRMTLRTLSIGYTIPREITSRLNIGAVRFHLTALNVLNFYNPYPKKYRDPASNYYGYPTLRSISLGINLTL